MAKAKKITQVKLSLEKLQELKDSIASGESPKSIHEILGASLANIHYHKAELKRKGLMKNGAVKKPASVKKSASKSVTGKTSAKSAPSVAAAPKEKSKAKAFKLIVNGVSIQIEGAGSVSVSEDSIKVDY